MAHVHIKDDRDHKVFVFIRDQLGAAAALIKSGNPGGAKLTALLRQYWPPHDAPDGKLVGIVDVYLADSDAEAPTETVVASSDSPRPTTHEDLLAVYNTRASEHGCGFLLAGELDEAAHVLINGEPALGQNKFKLRLPPSTWGYIELSWGSRELQRFGCGVTYYAVDGRHPPLKAIETAFIELLDGAVPAS